jgi:hypothetical protein
VNVLVQRKFAFIILKSPTEIFKQKFLMKKFSFFLTVLFYTHLNAHAQQITDSDLPMIINDTLFTTIGYPIVKGMDVKIGIGSTPDGDFKFIRRNAASMFAYHSNTGYQGLANQANALPRSSSGLKYEVLRIEKRGDKKHGYVYYCVLKTGLARFEVDVENAVSSGELYVPNEFKKNKPGISAVSEKGISIADELKKLKELLDQGVISQDEFDVQKKKLLTQ